MKLVSFLLFWQYCILRSLSFIPSTELRLFDHLFKDYNPVVRSGNSSAPVVIAVLMHIDSIVDVKEKEGAITIAGYVLMTWNDSSLCWNPADYENVTYMVIPSEKIWLPDIASSSAFENQEFPTKNVAVRVNSDCTVMFAAGGLSTHSCNFDTTLFPFDTQSCHFYVNRRFSGVDKIILQNETFEFGGGEENEVWNVIGTDTKFVLLGEWVEFILTIRRKPVYYVMYIVIPLIMMAAVNITVFCLPTQSGEKLSLSITVLLAFYILLFTIKDVLPVSSSSTPLLTIYAVCLIFISTLSAMVTAFIVRLHHYGNRPISPWVIHFLRLGRKTRFVKPQDDQGQEWPSPEPSLGSTAPEPTPERLPSWIEVSAAVDSLSFYAFLSIECILSLSIGLAYATLLHGNRCSE